mmetsp:Transcript_29612/g.70550  ORF Transcript_29612/g.70550 Transcript_29612/m.70550 type:complete len:543 (-) Transcript_29612:2170-3798(-)
MHYLQLTPVTTALYSTVLLSLLWNQSICVARNWASSSLVSYKNYSARKSFQRNLLQQRQTITLELAKERIVPEPLDWTVFEIEVSNARGLREAICEAQGGIYRQSNGEDVADCVSLGNSLKKMLVYLVDDVFLRGSRLPPINGNLKIEGRCANRQGQICGIHAVDSRCSSCPLPIEEPDTMMPAMCDPCRFGNEDGRETTPFELFPTARLWLRNVELTGCKTRDNGGCIKVTSGESSVWGNADIAASSLTYLQADNCIFRRGYASREGGAMVMRKGSLGLLRNCTFQWNYAEASSDANSNPLAQKSHDALIESYAAVIVSNAIFMERLYFKTTELVEGAEGFVLPFQEAQLFREDDPSPSGSQQTEPPEGEGGEGPSDAAGGGSGSDEQSGGGVSIPIVFDVDDGDDGIDTWLLAILIGVGVVLGGTTVMCCLWCFLTGAKDSAAEDVMDSARPQSMFEHLTGTQGMVGRSVSRFGSHLSNLTTRFQSAFQSYMQDQARESGGRAPATYAIPGTNRRYNIDQLMRGRQSRVGEDTSNTGEAD